ncbi:MAG: RNA methyltransferase, partial [Bacteroidia bacterium]|nr:RNA methyltransferase [Bacteroidia bacterium]
SIARLKDRKHRRLSGRFWVEGEKLTREALMHSQLQIVKVVVTREFAERKTDFPFPWDKTAFVSPSAFRRLSHLENSEPVGAVALVPPQERRLPPGPGLILWGVRDPANLGAVLRVADWFGMGCVAVVGPSVDLYNIKTLRAAMGSAFRVPVPNLGDGKDFLARFGCECIAADPNGSLCAYEPTAWKAKRFIVLGSESRGLPSEIKNTLATVRIPGSGGAESLNMAVAAGILAFARRLFDQSA